MKSRGFTRHFSVNLAGSISGLMVMLVTVPMFISHIGPSRYGVLALIWLLLGTLGFLDLGLSRATTNALSQIGNSNRQQRQEIFITAVSLNILMGGLGAIGLRWGGVALFSHIVSLPAELVPEVEKAVPWISALLPLALANGVGIGSLESRDQFLTANLLQLSGTLAIQIVPLVCAVSLGPQLEIIVPAAVLARGASVMLILGWTWRAELGFNFVLPDRTAARELLRFGSWVSISNIISPLLNSLDQFILGGTLGVTSVAHYSVPFSVVSKSQILPAAVARSLFPRMSRATEGEAIALAEQAIVALCYFYGALCIAAIAIMQPFLRWWMGDDFSQVASPVGEILLIGMWFNGLAFIAFELLQSQKKPHIPAILHALEIVPFAIVLWLATMKFGLIGTASAWTLRMAIDATSLFALSKLSDFLIFQVSATAIIILSTAIAFLYFRFLTYPGICIGAVIAAITTASGIYLNRNRIGIINFCPPMLYRLRRPIPSEDDCDG